MNYDINLLEKNNEIVGILKEIEKSQNSIKLDFSINKKIQILYDKKTFDKLKKLRGRKIGITNIDNQFFIRCIKEG
jgi:hypothetical protein